MEKPSSPLLGIRKCHSLDNFHWHDCVRTKWGAFFHTKKLPAWDNSRECIPCDELAEMMAPSLKQEALGCVDLDQWVGEMDTDCDGNVNKIDFITNLWKGPPQTFVEAMQISCLSHAPDEPTKASSQDCEESFGTQTSLDVRSEQGRCELLQEELSRASLSLSEWKSLSKQFHEFEEELSQAISRQTESEKARDVAKHKLRKTKVAYKGLKSQLEDVRKQIDEKDSLLKQYAVTMEPDLHGSQETDKETEKQRHELKKTKAAYKAMKRMVGRLQQEVEEKETQLAAMKETVEETAEGLRYWGSRSFSDRSVSSEKEHFLRDVALIVDKLEESVEEFIRRDVFCKPSIKCDQVDFEALLAQS
eukprot:Platyproteum_vivax@DN6024_c0_g1_i2.p1